MEEEEDDCNEEVKNKEVKEEGEKIDSNIEFKWGKWWEQFMTLSLQLLGSWLAQLVKIFTFRPQGPSSIPAAGSTMIWTDLCDFLSRLS